MGDVMPTALARFPLRATLAGFHRFSVDEYHKLIELGILTEDDQLELLDGYLVEKVPHDPIHDGTIDIVRAVLASVVPSGWLIRTQQSLTLSSSEPEPDLAIVRGNPRSYLAAHPKPQDFGVLIEVSNTSLDSDRDDKIPLYAHDGVPVYWIVNLVDRQVEVYEQPTGASPSPTYGSQRIYKPGDAVPVPLGGASVGSIAVVDLLP